MAGFVSAWVGEYYSRGVSPCVALVAIDASDGSDWQAAIRAACSALPAGESGDGRGTRYYVALRGGVFDGEACERITRAAVRSLSRVFDAACDAGRAMADIVPLLPTAGWASDLSVAPGSERLDPALLSDLELLVSVGAPDAPWTAAAAARRSARGLRQLPVVGVTIAGEDAAEADDDNDREIEGDDTPKGPLEFAAGAVGGTFDRLHAGHRLLLATTALVVARKIYVGIAGDELLKGKHFAELLQPFDARARGVREYLERVAPRLDLEFSQLLDPKAPPKAATLADITTLVVSHETVVGARKVEAMRAANGIAEPLQLVVVHLVGCEDRARRTDAAAPKLGSTSLRRKEADLNENW